jgi:hypothetical protein
MSLFKSPSLTILLEQLKGKGIPIRFQGGKMSPFLFTYSHKIDCLFKKTLLLEILLVSQKLITISIQTLSPKQNPLLKRISKPHAYQINSYCISTLI